MKICYICADSGIPILGRKGCSTHVRETSRALQQAGHEVTIITPNRGEDTSGNSDINIIEIPPYRKKWMGSDLRHSLFNRKMIQAADKLFQKDMPDVIYERYSLYSTAGSKLAKKYNLPRILEVNSFLVHEQKDRLHFPAFAAKVENKILLGAPFVIVVSKPLKDSFLELGVPAENITIMPMAVDVKTFTPDVPPADIKGELGLPQENTIVGYVGTLTGWHGIDLIFEVARQLKEKKEPISLVVIGGDAPKVENNRKLATEKQLDDIISFMGSVSYQKVPSYISALDITLISGSHTWASPTKLFEYQAMGKAAIAPRLIPVQEALIHGGEGLLFEPGNVDEIVKNILVLHRDPELRKVMGEKARIRVARTHAWENNTSQIISIFDKMIEEKKNNGTAP